MRLPCGEHVTRFELPRQSRMGRSLRPAVAEVSRRTNWHGARGSSRSCNVSIGSLNNVKHGNRERLFVLTTWQFARRSDSNAINSEHPLRRLVPQMRSGPEPSKPRNWHTSRRVRPKRKQTTRSWL